MKTKLLLIFLFAFIYAKSTTSYKFDGSTKYVTFAGDGLDGITTGASKDFKLIFWHMRESVGNIEHIASKWDANGTNQRSWLLRYTAANKIEFLISHNGTSTTSFVTTTAFKNIADIRKIEVRFVNTGSLVWSNVVQIYVDDVFYAHGKTGSATSTTKKIFDSTASLRWGVINGSSGLANYLSGYVTKCEVYSSGSLYDYWDLVNDTFSTEWSIISNSGTRDGTSVNMVSGDRMNTPLVEAYVVYEYGQSNALGHEAMAVLQAGYQSVFSNIQTWAGSNFESLNYATNNNQYPVRNNRFGSSFSLLTKLSAYYGKTIYWAGPAWGSCGLAAGAGSAGDLTPSLSTSHYDNAKAIWQAADAKLAESYGTHIKRIFVLTFGEADAKNPYAYDFRENLDTLINDYLRVDLNDTNMPILICYLKTTINSTTCPLFAVTNSAIDSTILNIPNVYGISVSNCRYETTNADSIHYDFSGYEQKGINTKDTIINNSLFNY